MLVYDVDRDEIRDLPRAEAHAGVMRYARSLGPGTPACGVYEQRALALAEIPTYWAGVPGTEPETDCQRCGVRIFYRDGRWHAVTLGSVGDVCPDEAAGIVHNDHQPGTQAAPA